MKKLIAVSTLAIACMVAVNVQQANAAHYTEEKKPDSKMIQAAHHDFPQAKKITWSESGGNYIAKFNSCNRLITATYNPKGKLLSTLIYSAAEDIPFEAQTNLLKKYPDYTVQCMKEFITKDGQNYYFILKSQRGSQVSWLRLKSTDYRAFVVLQHLHQTT